MDHGERIIPSESWKAVRRRVWLRRLNVMFGVWAFWAMILAMAVDWSIQWQLLSVRVFVGVGAALLLGSAVALIGERPRKVMVLTSDDPPSIDILR